MTAYQWLVFFLVVQIIHFLGTWKLYQKAGRKSWEAAIPVYNAIVLMKIIGRPTWWTILLFMPVINLIMFPVIWVETLRSFGKNTTLDTILGIITFGLYIYYINYTDVNYVKERSLKPQTAAADTLSSILFAIIVATFVHTYFIQPFTIPTSSLEKTLLVGDFLFVSKMNYGARTPMTPVAAPMVHDTIPFVNVKSYSNWPQLPYFRFPKFESIKNNDIVVFNYPVDTMFNMYKRSDKRYNKPVDKKTNYVKRCVGIPGDSLSIKDGIVFINGKELILPQRAKPQHAYKFVYDRKTPVDFDYLFTDMGVTDGFRQNIGDTNVVAALTDENAKRLKNIPGITFVGRVISKEPESNIFPNAATGWNGDNFGPIYIPKEGIAVPLTLKSLPFYKKIITEYEGNNLKVIGNDIYINDRIATTYSFKQNYYWMMGDNRHNSLDSRYWGYVPENHVVGKPVFIWMSWDTAGKGINKIRWSRLFTTVGGNGQPQSYFKYFLFILALYFAVDYGIKKRREKKS